MRSAWKHHDWPLEAVQALDEANAELAAALERADGLEADLAQAEEDEQEAVDDCRDAEKEAERYRDALKALLSAAEDVWPLLDRQLRALGYPEDRDVLRLRAHMDAAARVVEPLRERRASRHG